MEFFIKKNSTLPVLKINVIKDGRSDYNKSIRFLDETDIYFSMVDTQTGIPKITSKTAGVMKKNGSDDEYYVYYQFTPSETKNVGRYKGQFLFKNETGVMNLPISQSIYVNITDSFIIDDMEFSNKYTVDYPCCIGPIPFSPIPPTPPIPPITTTTTYHFTTTSTTNY
jgi:hypothetical protein